VVAAPNPAAFQFRILRRYWPHVDAPRHVMLIPIALLIRHARALGLKEVFITTTDEGTLVNNTFGWQQSLSTSFAHPRAKSVARRIGRVITRLVRPIERNGLRGTTYTIIFQKDI
jgi:hypothetical protein